MSKQHSIKMKLPQLLSVLAISLLSNGAQASTKSTDIVSNSAETLGLTNYRYFIIYPHLEKAFKAQQRNDEHTALQEFEHAHEQAPDNIPLVLYLSEAYRHFGHNDRAQNLLNEQLKRHPNDTSLQQVLEAIPQKPITTVTELLAQQQRCNENASTHCRSEVGQNALRLGNLQIAQQQLAAPEFTMTQQGQALLEDTLQRAVYLQQWHTADELWTQRHLQRELSPTEQQQWFTVLLAGKLDDRIEALQAQSLFNAASQQLAYASSLMQRGERQRLQHYLGNQSPVFSSAEEEKGWLYLISRYSDQPKKALAQYQTQFAKNRRYIVGATLPAALKAKNYSAAQALLDRMPSNELLDERYTVSQAVHNTAETLRLARQMYTHNPSLSRLDQLTWQLMEAGKSKEAATLLLQRYPYTGGDSSLSLTLLGRLVGLLRGHPDWATPAQNAYLATPLPTPQKRDLQRQLPSVEHNCNATRNLLGDMAATYSAGAWDQLADCYRDSTPGMALYALQQAQERSPSAYHQRAIAYQAYAIHDYASAMNAWSTLNPAKLTDQDLMAAANTAQAVGNSDMRDQWLAEAQKKGLDNTERYWWLHAQRYLENQPAQALHDLNQAIYSTAQPSAQTYILRADTYHRLGDTQHAIEDLKQAQRLDPQNYDAQVALGYAYWDNGDIALSRDTLEKIPSQGAVEIDKQLTYANQRLGDISRTQHHAHRVINNIDQISRFRALTSEQNQERFDFRRIHEDASRRWTFNLDSTIGVSSGAISNPSSGSNSSPQHHRSYTQFEAEYRIKRNVLIEGDLLSAYSRLSLDTYNSGIVIPLKQPVLGAGLRWKPLRDQTFFLALEQQAPLDHDHGEYNTLVRVSASFFNNGQFSDEWHPNGNSWLAQNLYLDAAEYMRHDTRAWTADYRISRHNKIAANQTIEPYMHVQTNAYRGIDNVTRGSQLGGLGARWNIWSGDTYYDAWLHKVSLGAEYQRTFKNINQKTEQRNGAFITVGVHW